LFKLPLRAASFHGASRCLGHELGRRERRRRFRKEGRKKEKKRKEEIGQEEK
jgi:hypothetical protein